MYNLCDLLYCNKFISCYIFEKLIDIFCFKFSFFWVVIFFSKNFIFIDIILVELLEYWIVYDILKEEKKSMINLEIGKKVLMGWWVVFICIYNLVIGIMLLIIKFISG